MLSVHNILDVDLIAKGQAGDDRWIELELVMASGTARMTFFFTVGSQASRKFERLRQLIAEERLDHESPFFHEVSNEQD